jgi:hypothetical protein
MEMDSVIPQVGGLNKSCNIENPPHLSLCTLTTHYIHPKWLLIRMLTIPPLWAKLTDSGDEKLVFESSEQVSVVRLAALCSVFIGRSGGAYHGYFCSFRL